MQALSPDIEPLWTAMARAWTDLRKHPADASLWAGFMLRCDQFILQASEQGLTAAAVAMAPLLDRLESLSRPGPGDIAAIQALLPPVEAALEHPLTDPGATPRVASTRREGDVPLLVLYGTDARTAHDLEPQLTHYGLRLEWCADPVSALAAATDGPATAVLVDVDAGFSPMIDATVAELGRRGIAWCAIATHSDYALRLQAVRRGACFFFVAPLTMAALMPVIDPLAFPIEEPPYRVLMLDDSRTVLAGTRRAMAPFADIQLGILSQPHKVLEVLQFFSPDVLLLDIHLQGCTGLEVAQIIRQHKTFESVPIVFLTGETDPKAQNEAMRLGADDLLLKPIATELLYNVVTQKAKRYRGLRRLMEEDSMTGLYNHGKTKLLLQQHLLQAARLNKPMAYALLDVDYFKRINDTHGHGTGDQVIMSLSRHLKQRVRATDVVGRYGGEEFALLLFDCAPQEAVELVDELRESFAALVHDPAGSCFSATFSGGVAFYPDCRNVPTLMARADEALYEAKRAGRNRVVASAVRGEPGA